MLKNFGIIDTDVSFIPDSASDENEHKIASDETETVFDHKERGIFSGFRKERAAARRLRYRPHQGKIETTENELEKARKETSSVEKTTCKMPKSIRLKSMIAWKQTQRFSSKSSLLQKRRK